MSGSCNNTAGVDFSEDILKHASLPFGKVTVLVVQGKIALSFLFLLTFCGSFVVEQVGSCILALLGAELFQEQL